MDGISAVASVAGIAAVGVQLSKSLCDIVATIRNGKEEIEDIANNISLLAWVLQELQDVLDYEKSNFKPELEKKARAIVLRCESIFKDISKHTGDRKGTTSSKLLWYFERERVKPLRASLESLKSTLNILLNVVHLARTTQEAMKSSVESAIERKVRKERRSLVIHVIDNRRGVARLKLLEEEIRRHSLNFDLEDLPSIYNGTSPLPPIFQQKYKRNPELEFAGPVARSSAENSPKSEDHKTKQRASDSSDDSSPSKAHSHERRRDRAGATPRPDHGVRNPMKRDGVVRSSSVNSHHARRRTRSPTRPRSETRSSIEPPLSSLILSIIPHEKIDEIVPATLLNSDSERLEAKAESTIDLLLDEWTYVTTSHGIRPQSTGTVNAASTAPTPRRALRSERDEYTEEYKKARGQNPLEPKPPPPPAKNTERPKKITKEVPTSRGHDAFMATYGDNGTPKCGKDNSTKAMDREPSIERIERAKPIGIKETNFTPSTAVRAKARGATDPSFIEHSYGSSLSYGPYSQMYPMQYQVYPTYNVLPPSVPFPAPPPPIPTKTPPPPVRVETPPPVHTPQPAPSVPNAPVMPSAPTAQNPLQSSSESILASPDALFLAQAGRNVDGRPSETAFETMERFLAIWEKEKKDTGALEAKYRQLEDEVRINAAIERFKQEAIEAKEAELNSRPITLHDCLDRKFVFPLEMCRSWWAMEGLVRRRFSPDDEIGSRVYKREYDILSPTGDIILPETWELTVRPGWTVEMRLSPTTPGFDRKSVGVPTYGKSSAYDHRLGPPASHASLRPPSTQDFISSGASASNAPRRSSIKAWFSGRRLSRSASYA